MNVKAAVDWRKVDQILSAEIFFYAVDALRLSLVLRFT
jgi:hypothetical protein